jgi:hypothetical protein
MYKNTSIPCIFVLQTLPNLKIMNLRLSDYLLGSIIFFLFACKSGDMGLNNPVNASVLGSEYASDIPKGNKKYIGKYITVEGEISQYYQNKFLENILIIMDKDKKYGVKCTLIKSKKELDKPFKLGDIIKINGRCSGYDEFVLLSGCLIIKN